MRKIALLSILLIAGFNTAAAASLTGCKNHVIKRGSLRAEVLKYCGSPDDVVVHSEQSISSNAVNDVAAGSITNQTQVSLRPSVLKIKAKNRRTSIRSRKKVSSRSQVVDSRVESWTYLSTQTRPTRTIEFVNGLVSNIQNH